MSRIAAGSAMVAMGRIVAWHLGHMSAITARRMTLATREPGCGRLDAPV